MPVPFESEVRSRASLFGVTLAPVAGRFGWYWGIVAGFAHSSAAQSAGDLHVEFVLYSNDFAAGLAASVPTPAILAVQSRSDDQNVGTDEKL